MDLSGYTDFDRSWLLPGPYGTMSLADLGADVIVIENPKRSDYARWPPSAVGSTGTGALFYAVTRNILTPDATVTGAQPDRIVDDVLESVPVSTVE